jgi:uncharacterized membrane protein
MTRLARRRAAVRDERGAVAIFTALVLVVVLMSAALAIDLGKQRVVRADMQALADVVSLDLARSLGADNVQTMLTAAAFRAAVSRSVSGNDGVLGDPPTVTVELGSFDGEFSEFGRYVYDHATGSFSAPVITDGDAIPTAVRVTSEGSVAFGFTSGSGAATRSAVSVADAGGCFSLGSYAARVDTGDSFILGPLLAVLGTGIDLDLLDLQGLAAADITVLDLVETDLVAGGFDQFLAATVGLDEFLVAVADALRANSGETAEVQLLDSLAGLTLPALQVPLGELLDLEAGSATALTAGLNVLDLVAGGVFLGNGTNPIRLPLELNVGTITNVTVDVVIGQRPIITCGRKGVTGETTQIGIVIGGQLANIDLGVARITAPISLELAVDPAEATLADLRCDADDRALDFLVSSGLLDLDVLVGSSLNPDALAVRVTGIRIANGFISASGSRPGGSADSGTVTVTDGDYAGAAPVETGDGSLGLPALGPLVNGLALLPGVPLIGDLLTLIGGLVTGVLNPVLTLVVSPLVQAVDTVVLSPLLESLGINLTGADVHAVPRSECALPRLAQ